MLLIATLSPNFITNQNARLSGLFEHALDRLVKAVDGQPAPWTESEFILKPSADQAVKALKTMAGRWVAFDVETDGGHPLENQLRCVGFYDGQRALFVPLLYRTGERETVPVRNRRTGAIDLEEQAVWAPYFKGAARTKVVLAMKQLLSCRGPHGAAGLYAQNGQYDRMVLRARLEFGIPAGATGFTFDTMVSSHVLTPYLPHDLGLLAALYTNAPFYKKTASGGWAASNDHDLAVYNLRDVKTTWLIGETMKHELPAEYPEAQHIFEHDMWQEQECENWKRVGFEVDKEALALFRFMYMSRRDKALAAMKELLARFGVGSQDENFKALMEKLSGKADVEDLDVDGSGSAVELFNPGSLIQLRQMLRGLKIPLEEVTATGQLSTAKEILTGARKELLLSGAKADDPRVAFLDFLFAWRESAKVVGTYLYPEILADARVHPNFSVHIVPTGRLSSSQPNFQNQPAEIRGMFVARAGHTIISQDWDALEMRLGAFLSQDPKYIEVFKAYDAKTGPKPHHANMAAIFGLPPTKAAAEQNPGMYRAAKVFAYACCGAQTRVALLNGEKEIQHVMPGDMTWCWDGTKQVPARIKNVFNNGTREVFKVTVQGQGGKREKKTVFLTGDHKMLLRDGTKRRLDALQPGTRLMPFRRYQMTSGYMEIDPTNDGSRCYEHRWVASQVGVQGEHIHHLDGSRTNNRPENLAAITNADHQREHGTLQRPEVRAKTALSSAKELRARWATDHEGTNAKLIEARRQSPWWQAKYAEAEARLIESRKGRDAWVAAGRPRKAPKCFACGALRKRALIQGLCNPCYQPVARAEHANHRIVSIEPAGEMPVFDLEVEHTGHNYALAVGIMVSNCAYGAGEDTVYEQVREEMPDMGWDAFQAAYSAYKTTYPTLFHFQAEVVRRGSKQGFLASGVLGRRGYFFERNWGQTSPEATAMQNFPYQSTGADIVSLANRRVMEQLVIPWRQSRLKKGEVIEQLAQVHDELVFEVPLRIADEFMAECKRISEQKPVKPDGTVLDWNLPVDAHHSRRWKPVQTRCACRELIDIELAGPHHWEGTCPKCKAVKSIDVPEEYW